MDQAPGCPCCSLPLSVVEIDPGRSICTHCGSLIAMGEQLPSSKRAGNQGSGARFELIARIGSGSYGAVWRAKDTELRRDVAVKLLHPHLLESASIRERFFREARTVAQLRHPGIVTVHEVTIIHDSPAMVSDLLAGVTIGEFCRSHRVDHRGIAGLVHQAAEAMEYAHSMGVIHRDIKPGNLMVEPETMRVVVLDFGLALSEEVEAVLTTDGQLVGTPAYMSPEQAAGRVGEVDRRSDIYGLGAVLYELLGGEPPFAGDHVSVLGRVLRDDPPALRSRDGTIPADLESICTKAMEKNPARRYQTARDLANDLRRFLNGEPVMARPVGRLERLARWCGRNRSLAAALGIAGLLLIAVAATATVSTIRIRHEQRATLENLAASYVEEAQARMATTRPGRHFESMRALTRAAAIRPSPQIRDEMTAALQLVDVEPDRSWRLRPPWQEQRDGVAIDGAFRRCVEYHTGDSLRVWSLPDSTTIATLPPSYSVPASSVWLSASGRFLLVGQQPGREVWIYNLDERKMVYRAPSQVWGGTGNFSADDRTVTLVAGDRVFVTLDLPSGREIRRVAYDRKVGSYVVDHAGRRAVVREVASRSTYLFDLSTGSKRILMGPDDGEVSSWAPDDRRVAVLNNLEAQVLDTETMERVTLRGHWNAVQYATWSPAGDLVATYGWDDMTRVWNPWTGAELVATEGCAIRFDATGARLAYAHRSAIGWWKVANNGVCRCVASRGETGTGPWEVAIEPRGRVFATACDDGTRIWDRAEMLDIARLPTGWTRGVCFDSTGDHLVTVSSRGIYRWDLSYDDAAGRLEISAPHAILKLKLPFGGSFLQFDSRGRWMATPMPGGRVLRVDLGCGDTLSVGPHPAVKTSGISRDGRWIVSATQHGRDVKVWDVTTGRTVLDLHGGAGIGGFSPDGTSLITTFGGDSPRVWDVPSFRMRFAYPTESALLHYYGDGDLAMQLRPDAGVHISSCRDGHDIATLASLLPMGVNEAASTPDGAWIVGTSINIHLVQVWDVRTIRDELANHGLDWDLPRIPASDAHSVPYTTARVDPGMLGAPGDDPPR